MINVGRHVLSKRFAQTFTVYRKSGTWNAGRWTPGTDAPLSMVGTITVPNEADLQQVAEGDRVKGSIVVYTTQQLNLTNASGTSDEILWNGQRYRIAQLWPMLQYGYYRAMAVRMDDK